MHLSVSSWSIQTHEKWNTGQEKDAGDAEQEDDVEDEDATKAESKDHEDEDASHKEQAKGKNDEGTYNFGWWINNL